jgi:polyisoprenoid-binding protein YceI
MSTETINQQQIPAGTWALDPVHSSITFAVTHNGVTTFRSGFESYDARLTGGEQPRLEGTVEVASIEIDEEMLKGHLLRLTGELEIRGETRSVEAGGRFAQLGEDAYGKARVGLSIETTVDRRDFGLDWQAQLPSGGEVLDYAVTINVDLELVGEGE